MIITVETLSQSTHRQTGCPADRGTPGTMSPADARLSGGLDLANKTASHRHSRPPIGPHAVIGTVRTLGNVIAASRVYGSRAMKQGRSAGFRSATSKAGRPR